MNNLIIKQINENMATNIMVAGIIHGAVGENLLGSLVSLSIVL